MSIMDINSQSAMAKKLSIPQLEAAVRNGTLDSFIAIPLIAQKTKLANAARAGEQPSSSVAAQVLQQAQQGVAQLPSNLPEEGMAGGGIIAFAEGGDAEDFDVEAYREQQDEDEYADALRSFMAASEAAGEEGISSRRKKDKKYAEGGIASLNEGGAIRFQSRGLVGDPDVLERMRTEDPEGYARVMREIPVAPASHANYVEPRLSVEQQAGMNDPMVDIGMMRGTPDVRTPPTVPTLSPVVVTPANASPDSRYIPTNTEDMDITRDTGIAGGALPKRPPNVSVAPKGNVEPTSRGIADQINRPRSAYDDFLDEIRAGREDLKTQAQKDKYMALVSAGLGMMSGTSPNAFANIGQGAQAGVASYMASGKQRAAEKAALNKNLLMGRRYQSMEDIANRTADINERRYAAIAAARGSGGDGKAEAQLDRQENAFTTRLRNAQATVLSALQAKFGKDGALIDPKGYAKAEQELTQKYVAPVMTMQERFLAKRYPDVFGDQAEAPVAPTPKSGFRIVQ